MYVIIIPRHWLVPFLRGRAESNPQQIFVWSPLYSFVLLFQVCPPKLHPIYLLYQGPVSVLLKHRLLLPLGIFIVSKFCQPTKTHNIRRIEKRAAFIRGNLLIGPLTTWSTGFRLFFWIPFGFWMPLANCLLTPSLVQDIHLISISLTVCVNSNSIFFHQRARQKSIAKLIIH